MNKKALKIFIFFIAAAVMFIFNFLRTENSNDRIYKQINIADTKIEECVIDIGKMGTLKYYLQPDVYTVYLRFKTKDKDGKIFYEIENLTADVSQGSKKGIWEKLKSNSLVKINERGFIPLNLEIKIPYDKIDSYNVQRGTVKLLKDKNVISTVNLTIINSKYK